MLITPATISTLLAALALSWIEFGAASSTQPVGAAPAGAVSVEARVNERALAALDLETITDSYVDSIRQLDTSNGAALYRAQQTGMPLVHAIFTLGSARQRASALGATADLLRSLPTAKQLRELDLDDDGFDGFPIPSGREVSKRRLFPMRDGGELKMLSGNAQQFGYLLSTVLRLAAQSETPSDDAETWSDDLRTLHGFVLDDILRLYWLEAPAWHWAGAYPNMRSRTLARLAGEPKLSPRTFFRAFIDYDLHILAIAADLKAVQRVRPALAASAAGRALVDDASAIGMRVLRSRIDMGRDGRGFAFDRGMWDDNPVTQHADCRSLLPPARPCPGVLVAQDVSHAQRWPWWLQSHFEATRGTRANALVQRWREALARQVGEDVIGFDAGDRPIMTNFLDGRDGWYNYVVTPEGATGHRPSSLTGWSMRYGAWALLAPLNDDLADAYRSFCRVIASDAPADIAFRIRHYGAPGPDPANGFRSATDEYGHSSPYVAPCRIYAALGLI